MIKQQEKDILNEYAQIKRDIKSLEVKADELNVEVLVIMETNDLEEIQVSDLGKISLGSRRSWKYPKEITDLEEDLKAKKRETEQLGTAKYTEKKYCIFKGTKEQ